MKLKTLKRNYILLLVITASLCVSCESMLDTTPRDFYIEESFWKTQSHAIDAIAGAYRALNHSYMYG